jgi:hypothetical protein
VTGDWRKLHNEELRNLYPSSNIIRIALGVIIPLGATAQQVTQCNRMQKYNVIIRMIKSRRMRWAGYVARMVVKKNAYRILVGKREGKRALGRPRHKWVDNIKIDLREIGWDGMD